MLTWVVYDISVDRVRARIAKCCLDQGLYRIQRSVFLGDLQANEIEEILLFSEKTMDPTTDSVYIFPMCRPDFEKVRILGQGFDRAFVANEIQLKIL